MFSLLLTPKTVPLIAVFVAGVLSFGTYAIKTNTTSYHPDLGHHQQLGFIAVSEQKKDLFQAEHRTTPDAVKAVYMTSWVAGTEDLRQRIIDLIGATELNAVVIDIKDYTGEISFSVDNTLIDTIGSETNRISDIKEFLQQLHDQDIYVIGRLSVFQDPHYAAYAPQDAVKRGSDGELWKDHKGITWIDPGSQDMWNYSIALAKESYAVGFDEINFDYIRFPSDGNMRDIKYPHSEGRVKHEVMKEFFAYLDQELEGIDIVTSADLFGMTTTNKDDLNIGQVLEDALAHFDYIAPMVYPSHYPTNFIGLDNPAEHPYAVIHYTMQRAVERAIEYGVEPTVFRPWLQDFNLGATYTAERVRAQIEATYDVGLTSWMMWDPANRYTRAAYKDE